RGDEIEARGTGETGLDAVDAIDAAEQIVVVADRFAAKNERTSLEIFVIGWEPLLDGTSQDRLVSRGGNLVAVGQAGRVLVDRIGHAQRLRLPRHQLGELFLGPGKRLRDDNSRVIGGARDHALDRVLDLDGLAFLQVELGRRLVLGVRGYLER